jgi:DNA-binding transcriptional LysR family regulator
MARAGLGICPMDDIVGDRTAGMERILGDDLKVNFPVWLVTHREVHTSPRIRLVFDILAEAISTR